MEFGIVRCCIGKQVPRFSWSPKMFDCEGIRKPPHNMIISCKVKAGNTKSGPSYFSYRVKHKKYPFYAIPVNTEGSSSVGSEDNPTQEENESDESVDDPLSKPLGSEELKALLADKERAKLLDKLSEANQQNRFLKRELYSKEDVIFKFKSELATMELEIQALVTLAEEIAQLGIPEGTRKINGKYIQSHLLSRLEAVHGKLKEQIKGVEAAQSKEVPIFWLGMAESVQVMGTFDGWSQGEHLSPEYDGSFTKFTTTLMLRPGRYEIKFLVDGLWQLSPEYPTVGEGITKNNLLIVY